MRIAIIALLIASVSLLPAHAQDSTSPTTQPATNATHELKLPLREKCVKHLAKVTDEDCYNPPISVLVPFFVQSGFDKISTSVHLTYDENGRVTSAVLNQSTQNKKLDTAIVDWVKFIKFMPGPAGEGDLPMEFTLH